MNELTHPPVLFPFKAAAPPPPGPSPALVLIATVT